MRLKLLRQIARKALAPRKMAVAKIVAARMIAVKNLLQTVQNGGKDSIKISNHSKESL